MNFLSGGLGGRYKSQRMSWDIVLFNSKEKITSLGELDENKLAPSDFNAVFENYFKEILRDGKHREIKGKEYAIDYFVSDENASIQLLNLYGENGLYEIVALAKRYNWQIFDTGIGEMIDLENPSNNGYENFENYRKQILNQK